MYIPQWSYLKQFQQQDHLFKAQQKKNYDKRHRVQHLPSLPENTPVKITSGGVQHSSGTIVSQAATPRSYLVETPSGHVRRNCQHLIPIPENHPDTQPSDTDQRSSSPQSLPSPPSPIMTCSRTGITLKPPKKLTF